MHLIKVGDREAWREGWKQGDSECAHDALRVSIDQSRMPEVITLSIGDGANDVPMLKVSQIRRGRRHLTCTARCIPTFVDFRRRTLASASSAKKVRSLPSRPASGRTSLA